MNMTSPNQVQSTRTHVGEWLSSTCKVLVLGDGMGAFLSVVRSLGRRGIAVHIGWCDANSPAVRSRYVAQFHELPRPGAEDWKTSLINLLKRENFDLVIPTNEQSLRPLQQDSATLAEFVRLNIPDDKTFANVFDKQRSTELAKSLGIPVPHSVVAANLAHLLTAAEGNGFPLVLKPLSSYLDENLHERQNVFKAYNRQSLETHGGAMLRRGPVLAQENFIGVGVGVELLVNQGKVLFAFQHQRVHAPSKGGASSYRKSVPLRPDLLEAARKIVAALHYTGVIMVEYLVDLKSYDWRFVELNGRFWGSLPLALAAGADFPWFLYQMLVHGRHDFPQTYREGVYCRNLIADLKWMRENRRADHSDPTLATASMWQIIGELRHLLFGRESSDTFVLDDPKPGFAEVARYVIRSWSNFVDQTRVRLLSLNPIRRCYRRRLLKHLRSSQSVLFVCYGNICRSPFAEQYARSIATGKPLVASSGIVARPGRKSPPEAIEAAAELGISLLGHQANPLTVALVNTADLILTFDEAVHRRLVQQFPNAWKKIHRFGLLSDSGTVNVPDPYGLSIEEFRRSYRRIVEVIDSVWPTVHELADQVDKRL